MLWQRRYRCEKCGKYPRYSDRTGIMSCNCSRTTLINPDYKDWKVLPSKKNRGRRFYRAMRDKHLCWKDDSLKAICPLGDVFLKQLYTWNKRSTFNEKLAEKTCGNPCLAGLTIT